MNDELTPRCDAEQVKTLEAKIRELEEKLAPPTVWRIPAAALAQRLRDVPSGFLKSLNHI